MKCTERFSVEQTSIPWGSNMQCQSIITTNLECNSRILKYDQTLSVILYHIASALNQCKLIQTHTHTYIYIYIYIYVEIERKKRESSNIWLVGLVVWVLWHINLCRLFNAKSIFIQIVLFQTIQFSMSTQFHPHHVALVARISLTLSRHSSLSFIALGRSSGQHPVSSHSCWMYVRAGRPAFTRPCVGVHKSTSLMSSSLLLQVHNLIAKKISISSNLVHSNSSNSANEV